MEGFDAAFDYLIQNEGSAFTSDSVDPGGPTKFGITLPILSKYLDRVVDASDIRVIDEPTAKLLYKKLFWEAIYGDNLPYPIATALFDTAVNRGQLIAIGFAQNCLTNLHADGIIGEETLHALNSTDPEIFIYNYIGALQDSYIELCLHAPSQLKYLRGWLKRARRLFLLVEK